MRTGRRVIGCLIAAMSLASGCSQSTPSDDATVKVYMSTLLRIGTVEVRAMELALSEAHGRAGRFRVELVPREAGSDDEEGVVDEEKVASNARRAADDDAAIAYIGEDTSGATTVSLPITNRAGLLQVAIWAGRAGLTRPGSGEPDEPDRYYPTGRRTFARLVAQSDLEADALATWIRRSGNRRVAVVDDGQLFGDGLERAVRARLERAGSPAVNAPAKADGLFSTDDLVNVLQTTRAQAVVFCGVFPTKGYARLAERLPDLDIYTGGANFAAVSTESDQAGAARDQLHVLGDLIGADALGASQLAEFRGRFGERYGEQPADDTKAPEAYETMRAIIDAIATAGDRGDERAAVLAEFRATRRSASAIGPFAFDRFGDITGRVKGGYVIRDGDLTLDELFSSN